MYNLFPTPVNKVQITPTLEQFEKTNNLLSKIFADSSNAQWALEDGKSTGEHGLDLHTCPELEWLVSQTLGPIREYWDYLGYRKNATIVPDSAWANLHMFSQSTGEHAHCGGSSKSHISSVYYFKKPTNSGHIEFVDPLEYIHRMTPVHEFSERIGTYNKFEADTYDFVMFPSWLKHRTQANETNESRIAISINFIGLW